MMDMVLLIYVLMSALTFVIYAIDKSQARQGGWRISERTLHGLELLGGWPGALLAQRMVRHKTRKASYQGVFVGIILIHAAGWIWYLAA